MRKLAKKLSKLMKQQETTTNSNNISGNKPPLYFHAITAKTHRPINAITRQTGEVYRILIVI